MKKKKRRKIVAVNNTMNIVLLLNVGNPKKGKIIPLSFVISIYIIICSN